MHLLSPAQMEITAKIGLDSGGHLFKVNKRPPNAIHDTNNIGIKVPDLLIFGKIAKYKLKR